MVDSDTLRSGKTPFERREIDNDYSGLSISGRYLANANIEKSFFNGVNLSECSFSRVQLNNAEFSEAKITGCDFEHTNLSGSDFVDCLLERTTFTACTFEKGEWREATFSDCRFIECRFDHTTVALCRFAKCEFDEPSIASAEHRAIYFNVFTLCRFAVPVTDRVFASRNFGPPTISSHTELTQPSTGPEIEQVCLLNNIGQMRITNLADVAESICSSLGGGSQRRNSTLTFFSKIVRVLTDERRISATSLIYLEELITRFASSVKDQDLFMSAMGAVIEIRSALFAIASEEIVSPNDQHRRVQSVMIRFSPIYAQRQAAAFRDALAEAAGVSAPELRIDDVRPGSTVIELASTAILSVGTLLTGLNFVLRQATITIRHLKALKSSVRQTKRAKATKAPKREMSANRPTKVRAILKSGAVAPQLVPVRAAVRRNGRILVDMDEKAEVSVLTE